MERIKSQLAEKCKKCQYVNKCNEKRMAACAVLPLPDRMSESASERMTTPIANEIMVKHSYRDIKISPTQTITVDLEEMKKNLERDFYKAIGCPAFRFGA